MFLDLRFFFCCNFPPIILSVYYLSDPNGIEYVYHINTSNGLLFFFKNLKYFSKKFTVEFCLRLNIFFDGSNQPRTISPSSM